MVKKNSHAKRKSINKHEVEHFHIPKFSLYPLLGIMLFCFLTWISFQGFLLQWDLLKLNEVPMGLFVSVYQLLIIPVLLLCILMLDGLIISVVALFKKGYSNLKSPDEGLIFELILGLILGLVNGLIVGLFLGLSREFD